MQSEKNPWMISTLLLVGFIVGYGAGQVPTLFDQSAGNAAVVQAPSPAAPTPQAPPAPPKLTEDQIAALPDDDAVKGDAKAPVTIVEFSDYQCPFCSRFFTDTLPQIDEKYIKTGKAKLVYRDYPLSFHPQADDAALAAECAGDENKYWQMHDKLFANVDTWAVDGVKDVLVGYAKEMGLNVATFTDCFDSGKHRGEITKDLREGSAAGVSGTPGFFVNGKLISGAQPFAVFEQVIEAELEN